MASYREVQYIRQTWITAILVVPLGIVLFGLFQQVVLGRPWGNKPVSNQAFILIGTALCAFVVWLLNLKMVTEVRPDALFVGFRVLWWPRRIAMQEIASARAITYRPIAEYGGWGMRWSFRDSSMAYTARGDRAVEIVLQDGRRILIGSQRPEELETAIQARPTQT